MSSKTKNSGKKSHAGSQNSTKSGQHGGENINSFIVSETELEKFNEKMSRIVGQFLYDETFSTFHFLKSFLPEGVQDTPDDSTMWGALEGWNDEALFSSTETAGDCVVLAQEFLKNDSNVKNEQTPVQVVPVTILKHREGQVIVDSHVCPILMFKFSLCVPLLEAIQHPSSQEPLPVSGVVLFDVGLHKTVPTFVFENRTTTLHGGNETYFKTDSCVVRVSYINDPREYDVSEYELTPLTKERKWKIIRSSITERKPIYQIQKHSPTSGHQTASLILDFNREKVVININSKEEEVKFGEHKEKVQSWAISVELGDKGTNDQVTRINFLVENQAIVKKLASLPAHKTPSMALAQSTADERESSENPEEPDQ